MGPSNPHDALFKSLFGRPEVSADVVRRLLPPAARAHIDWDSFEPLPTEFVGADLTDRRADLVFRARIDGREGFVFVLLEHQSSPDGLMPYRALVYMVRIWERWRRDHPQATRLPAILPLVLYHGERPWTAPLDLRDLLDLPDALAQALDPHLPRLRLLLDDLNRTTDDEIETSTRVALTTAGLLMLRNRHRLEEPAALDRLIEHLVAVARIPGAVDAVVQSLYYIYRVSELQTGTVEQRIAHRVPPAVKEAVMTTAERLEARGEARGFAKGIEQGIEQGIERGRRQGQLAMLLRLLTDRFGEPDAATRARLDAADSDTLDRWTGRLFTARTLDELLG